MDTEFLVFDVDPTTGEVFPVTPEEHRDDTSGFTTPPVPMPRGQRRRWQRLLSKYRKTMSPARAWHRACVEAI